MNAYMTNGSLAFLLKMKEQHTDKDIYLMNGTDTTLAYYEDRESTFFETARQYEIVLSTGDLQEDGYVVMNNIPVTDEGRPIFEHQFKSRAGIIDGTPGFYALRVLRPIRGNTYVVMVQWEDQASYEKWKNSEAFAKSHKKDKKTKEKPPYAAGPSYVTTYHLADLEEDA
ncbi:antibiotic biosynthesis monooxygenase family protein [Aquibacillus albus]|uniref:Heme-degrading monooxygenase HmoA n=1 Tax=Aquibacillus albus TaxID=1168171 RepID=A0ABS2N005_9BACI|nr:antibiotic biosynthesis monooxygenase [Aquibacillus albus]MBM7571466.1 heme-degrading monooxygenase HmoA [Aquibacillus albus]